MKRTTILAKRVLISLLLVCTMIISLLFMPATGQNVSAATSEETPKVRLLTFSDYQKWTSNWTDDWNTLQSQLTGLVNSAYDSGVRPDYMIFGGDFSCLNSTSSSEEGMSQVKKIVRSKWDNLTDNEMILVQGKHVRSSSQPIRDYTMISTELMATTSMHISCLMRSMKLLRNWISYSCLDTIIQTGMN